MTEKDKNAFLRFIDESYLGYQFWIWATVLTILGIGALIAAFVASASVGKSQRDAIQASEFLGSDGGSPSDPAYVAWQSRSEQVGFTFFNVTGVKADGSLQYTPTPEFTYVVKTDKKDVKISPAKDTATYGQDVSKSFSSAGLSQQQVVNLPNTDYLDLLSQFPNGETDLFHMFWEDSEFDLDVQNFFEDTVPKVLGAQLITEQFPSFYEDQLRYISDFFVAELNTYLSDVDLFPLKFLHHTMLNFRPEFLSSGQPGFYNIYSWWMSDSDCRVDTGTPSPAALTVEWLRGFEDYVLLPDGTETQCQLMFKRMGSDAFSIDSGAQFTDFIAGFEDPSEIDKWLHPTSGICTTEAYIITGPFNSATQTESFCKTLIGFTTTVKESFGYTSIPKVGKEAFCTANPKLRSVPLELVSFPTSSLPPSTPYFLTTDTTTFDDADCDSVFANALDASIFWDAFKGETAPVFSPPLDPTAEAEIIAWAEEFRDQANPSPFRFLFKYLLLVPDSVVPVASNPLNDVSHAGPYNGKSASFFGIDFPEYQALVKYTSPFIGVLFSDLIQNNMPVTQSLAHANWGHFPDLTSKFKLPRLAFGSFAYVANITDTFSGALTGLNSDAKMSSFNTYANELAMYLLEAKHGIIDYGHEQFASGALLYDDCTTTILPKCSVFTRLYGDIKVYPEYGIARAIGPFSHSFASADSAPAITAAAVPAIFARFAAIAAAPKNAATDAMFLYYSSHLLQDMYLGNKGPIAKRTVAEWLNGIDNPVAEFYPSGTPHETAFFATSADPRTYTINTGQDSIAKAYRWNTISDMTTVPQDGGASVDISGMVNKDRFPPDVASGSSFTVLDIFTGHANTIKFSDNTEAIEGLEGLTATATPNYGDEQTLAVADDAYSVYSPCMRDVPSVVNVDAKTGFADEYVVHPLTGRVLSAKQCLVRSTTFATDTSTFPITLPEVTSASSFAVFTMSRSYTISPSVAKSYLQQFEPVDSQVSTIRTSLLIVGIVFLVLGAIFLGFAILRRYRKRQELANSEINMDPFNERGA